MKTPTTFKRTELFLATCMLSAGFSQGALAQAAGEGATISEILITGSRRSGMAVSDSPAPVQLISAEMLKETGAPDLMNAIATQVPSYNANQTGGDMASQTLTASMRALSANHALVLVNGKRRHTTSNVGASSGAAATDLSFIPSSAISRLEVLTDGAAAIYGSDAIAGVINIILNDDYEGGSVNTNVSEYVDGGGYTTNVQGNYGFGNDVAYLNVSLEAENRETVSRSVTYGPAVCVANPVECLNRLNNGTPSGYTVSSAYRTYLQRDSKMATHPKYPALNNVGDPPDIVRRAAFFNAGYQLNEDVELYGFASVGTKKAASLETYRRPSQDGGVDVNGDGDRNDMTPGGIPEYMINKYEFGFSPMEESDETDYSFTVGFTGVTNDWTWDLATVYGSNEMDVYTTKSMNFTLWNETGESQEDFYDGTFWATQWTTSLDASKEYDIGLAAPMTFATGLEYRRDRYGIDPGEPASYYGAGAASFPGYNPAVNTGAYDRHSYATFLNFVLVPTDSWLVDLAVRYEDYSDFGNETVGKITTRYDFSDAVAVRATASTGFRAPTLGEGFYSAVNVGPTSASPQLQPNSAAAAELGFGAGLQPETSENFSLGLVLEPINGLTTTIDAYQITISDRIQRGSFAFSTSQSNNTVTGRTTGSFNNILPDPADTDGNGTPDASYNEALGRALVNFGYIGVWNDPAAPGGSLDASARASISVSIFNNALETRSSGVDWVNTYNSRFGWGSIGWTLAANYNKTEVLSAKAAPASLGGATMYSALALSNLETNSPKYRVNLGARIMFGDFTLNVRQAVYGPQYTLTTVSGLPAAVRNSLDLVQLAGATYYKNEIDTLMQTNIELTYAPTDSLRLSAGVDNVFNEYPNKTPSAVWDYNEERYANTNREYLTGSPVGYFGARWFGKLAYTF
ncbi:MAG: TonB-dependent receptor [Gammaproteobacteria bacterium]|nr:TonB-dependent receptor [Gammaproteobacteria bacterium]MDP2140641.1 TonB-dependent receptor [Gammaproteobacteria bacterium]MDP2347413.1 TonB-dependent receptor [Gammaproteobacteria bacterium]